MKWGEGEGEGRHVASIGREERWIQEFWLGNQSERDHFKYPGTDGGVTKVDLQEDQYMDKSRTAVETEPKIQFPQNADNFLASWSTASYRSRTAGRLSSYIANQLISFYKNLPLPNVMIT